MAKDRTRIVPLHFPLGGVVRQYAYQHQAPYTTPDALNCRPDATLQGRERGGQRPGLDKAFYERLGESGDREVRLLAQLHYVGSSGFTVWTDDFQANALGDVWTAAAWVGTAPDLIDDGFTQVQYNESVGAMRDAFEDIDASQYYSIDLWISPYQGSHAGSYQIFARMTGNAGSGTPTDGIVATLTMDDDTGSFDGHLKVYASGSVTATYNFASGSDGDALYGRFTVLVDGDAITVTWRDHTLVNAQTVTTQAGTRLGFGASCTVSGSLCLMDAFRVQYFTSVVGNALRRMLITSAGGKLYRESTVGTLEQVTSDLTLSSGHGLHAIEYLGKLYIADWDEPAVFETGCTVTNTVITKAGVDWSVADTDDMVAVLSDASSGVIAGTYEIASSASGSMTLATDPGSGPATVRVARCPKLYDPLTNTLTRWVADTDKGEVPTGRPYIERYHDRLFLAGGTHDPHSWDCCRMGDPLDWLDTKVEEDVARPLSGQNSPAGRLGRAITSLTAHTDDYMVFGGAGETWVLKGDPAYGGWLDNASLVVGPIGDKSWARGPRGEFIELTQDGLYIMPPGADQFPQSMSRERLPLELLDVDVAHYEVLLEFDTKDEGVHIYLTPEDEKAVFHWWFDWGSRGFWPVSLQSEHEPFSILRYDSQVAEDSVVLLGCRDGYIRRFTSRATHDDGEGIYSYVDYGPLRIAGNDWESGLVAALVGTIAANSGDVTATLFVADSNEALQSASSSATYTLSAGRNNTWRPRRSGGSFILRLAQTSVGRTWATEAVTAELRPAGVQRL